LHLKKFWPGNDNIQNEAHNIVTHISVQKHSFLKINIMQGFIIKLRAVCIASM